MERETGKQRSLVRVLGRRAVPPCDLLAEACKGLTVPSLLQLLELYPSFLKYFPGSHRQIYKNLQEINVFIGRSVEKHRETLNPSAPRDFIDCYLLRMEKLFELYPSFLKYFPGSHRQIYKNLQEINVFIGRSVEKHCETLNPCAPGDFIDCYLLRMEKDKSDPQSQFDHGNLIMSVLSLFFAGTETTSTTLRYGFLLMLKYPHVAEKIHKEIDQVIGSHRPPALDDRAQMPYTDAVIHEIQRFSDLIPMGVPHMVTKDTHFRGYILPKGTEVYPILSSALHDSHYFEKPDDFNPNHFLDANGAVKKNDAFMPFSIGKRICLGEGIACTELFLFFTTILQNFSVATPVAPEDIDLTPQESGVGKVPLNYQIQFLPRQRG
ncbi:cytochrome P450 2B4-like [Dama dama]